MRPPSNRTIVVLNLPARTTVDGYWIVRSGGFQHLSLAPMYGSPSPQPCKDQKGSATDWKGPSALSDLIDGTERSRRAQGVASRATETPLSDLRESIITHPVPLTRATPLKRGLFTAEQARNRGAIRSSHTSFETFVTAKGIRAHPSWQRKHEH
jgi:hypothetical protein